MTPRAQRRAAWRSRFRHDAASAAAKPLAPASVRVAPRPAVAVRIDELTLRGFDSHSVPRIAASMERTLQRLIGSELPFGWRASGAVEALAARVRLPRMGGAAAIGEELARAVLSAHREDRA
jgi:hypothetical protein